MIPDSNFRFKRVAPVAGPLVAGIGVVVLAGWAFDIESLKSIIPGIIVMIPNTALAFVLSGTALTLLAAPQGERRVGAGRGLAAVAGAIGVAMFFQRMTGADLGINLLLFADSVQRYPYRPPGLMATNSSICLTLAGAALLTMDWEPRPGFRPSQWMALVGLMIASIALLGYLYGAQNLYTFDRAAGMALLTATAFFILHTGILFARPHRGGVTLLTGSNLGSAVARRLIGATVAVPVLLGWIWLQAREENLISRQGGIALLTLATIIVLATLLLQAASVLRATDVERETLLRSETAAREEAESARAIAEGASRAKSDFLATVSHELRTPLNAVIGYTSLMLDGISGPVSEAHAHQLGRIRLSARHLLSLIDEILSLTRLEAGKESLLLAEVDLREVLNESASIVEPLAQAKGLALIPDLPRTPILVTTDAGKIRQIVVNLLGNAVKFTDTGSIRLTVTASRDTAQVSVSDTGIGIRAEHVEKIFDPFWQVEQRAAQRAPGTGLGLSVSRRLARLLDGDITVDSTPGGGSSFHVRLPLRPRRSRETPPSTPLVSAAG